MKLIIQGRPFTKATALTEVGKILKKSRPVSASNRTLEPEEQNFIREYIRCGPRDYLLTAEKIEVLWWKYPTWGKKLFPVFLFHFKGGTDETVSYKKLLDNEKTLQKKRIQENMRQLVADQTARRGRLIADHVFPRTFADLVHNFWWKEKAPNPSWEQRWIEFHRRNAHLEWITEEENDRRAAEYNARISLRKEFISHLYD